MCEECWTISAIVRAAIETGCRPRSEEELHQAVTTVWHQDDTFARMLKLAGTVITIRNKGEAASDDEKKLITDLVEFQKKHNDMMTSLTAFSMFKKASSDPPSSPS